MDSRHIHVDLIKPTPDFFIQVEFELSPYGLRMVNPVFSIPNAILIFDGETQKLKDVAMIKKGTDQC